MRIEYQLSTSKTIILSYGFLLLQNIEQTSWFWISLAKPFFVYYISKFLNCFIFLQTA